MTQYFQDAHFDEQDRSLFAFASYNAGPANISKMRKEAAKRGLDADVWFNNVETVTAEKIGIETTTYVRNIYKYYVSYKLPLGREGGGGEAQGPGRPRQMIGPRAWPTDKTDKSARREIFYYDETGLMSASLGSLVLRLEIEPMRRLDAPHGSRLRAHHHGVRRRAAAEEAHAPQEIAGRHSGRREHHAAVHEVAE
jgi:hypothetical protein